MKTIIYLANPDHFLSGLGPCLNTSSAVSAYPKLGIFPFSHTFSEICTYNSKQPLTHRHFIVGDLATAYNNQARLRISLM